MEKLISVIVPIYNVEAYLEKCIKSIVNQTYKNLEIILVDDGSPDQCPAICDRWKLLDTRVSVIHKINGGLSAARNSGIEVATGEYLIFIDSDDFITESFIQKLYDAIIKNGADIAICNYNIVDNSGNKLISKTSINPFVVNGYNAVVKMENDHLSDFYVVVWNKLYKKELFDDVRFYEGKNHEDERISHVLLYKSNLVCGIKEANYNYVKRDGSIMSQISIRRIGDLIEAYIARSDFYKERNMHYLCALKQIHLQTLYREYKLNSPQIKKNNQLVLREQTKYFIFSKNVKFFEKVKFAVAYLNIGFYLNMKKLRLFKNIKYDGGTHVI